ncbi:unnamed protein product [Sphagnum balticum]
MSRLQGMLLVVVVALLAALVQIPGAAAGTRYTVSWNYPYSRTSFANWNKGTSYVVGDSIQFVYNAEAHNVVRVNKQQYDLCDSAGAVTHTDGATVFNLERPGRYFFMCSIPGHCQAGMKLALQVI